MAAKMYSIKELAAKTGLSTCYIRRSIGDGKLKSTLVPISDKVKRHEVTMADFNEFRKNTKARTTRDDGRNKFLGWMTADERAQVSKVLKANGLEAVDDLIVRANKASKAS